MRKRYGLRGRKEEVEEGSKKSGKMSFIMGM